jgi:hypothetical protein
MTAIVVLLPIELLLQSNEECMKPKFPTEPVNPSNKNETKKSIMWMITEPSHHEKRQAIQHPQGTRQSLKDKTHRKRANMNLARYSEVGRAIGCDSCMTQTVQHGLG